jgi:hypothetical protein
LVNAGDVDAVTSVCSSGLSFLLHWLHAVRDLQLYAAFSAHKVSMYALHLKKFGNIQEMNKVFYSEGTPGHKTGALYSDI